MYLEVLFTIILIPLFYTIYKHYKFISNIQNSKIYLLLRKMDIDFVDQPDDDNTTSMRKHIVENYIKTQEEVDTLTDDQVKKIYLSYNKKILDQTSDSVTTLAAKTYVDIIKNFAPRLTNFTVKNEDKFVNDLKKDMFVKSAINQYFPSVYYNYGAILAPLIVGIHTFNNLEKLNYVVENDESEIAEEN